MASCFGASDVAIVPASGILYEAIAAGCRVISGTYVENQKLLFQGMADLGALESAGTFDPEHLRRALLTVLLADQPARRLIDGLSKDRMIDKFLGLFCAIRAVKEEDCKLLFEWANDAEVRANAVHPEQITWEKHVSWFNQKVHSDQTRIFILEFRGTAVGQIRYDRGYEGWVIDYSIDKRFRGKGFGKLIVRTTLNNVRPEKVKALVKVSNVSSTKCFESLLFREAGIEVITDTEYKVFEM
jgi:RimJ/RimL family protein N-acetyltransferase